MTLHGYSARKAAQVAAFFAIKEGGAINVLKSPDKMHLFIIMTKACTDGCHLLLSVSSIKSDMYHDPACELLAGCHEFIRSKS